MARKWGLSIDEKERMELDDDLPRPVDRHKKIGSFD